MRTLHAILEAPGHLAIWVALYVPAYALAIIQLSGLSPDPLLYPALAATTIAAYLLDRIDLRAFSLPHQTDTHPRRSAFLKAHARPVAALLIAALISATILCAKLSPYAAAAPALSAAGVIVYARLGARGRRLRDRLLIKNLSVAASVLALILLLLLLTHAHARPLAEPLHIAPLAIASFFAGAAITIDAMLCDIPDVEADRLAGSRTLPMILGVRAAWRSAVIASFILMGITLLASSLARQPLAPAAIWTSLNCAGVIALRLAPVSALRDLCDLKAPLIAIVALLVL